MVFLFFSLSVFSVYIFSLSPFTYFLLPLSLYLPLCLHIYNLDPGLCVRRMMPLRSGCAGDSIARVMAHVRAYQAYILPVLYDPVPPGVYRHYLHQAFTRHGLRDIYKFYSLLSLKFSCIKIAHFSQVQSNIILYIQYNNILLELY